MDAKNKEESPNVDNRTSVEHESLRSEILKRNEESIGVTSFVLAFTGAAFIAAFQFRNPYVALLPLLVLYFGKRLVFNSTQTIIRISVYLQVFGRDRYEQFCTDYGSNC